MSRYIAAMPLLWLGIFDEPGPESLRGFVEANAIALLSNHRRMPVDVASGGWLGHYSDRTLVRSSGLWNQRHVESEHDPLFLDAFERLIDLMGRGA